MKSTNVSVCMIAKNCADIVDVSLRWATENFYSVHVVVDTFNDDNTLEVLKSWVPKINLVEHKFDNFSAQKNRAFNLAQTPWILSVDTDEIYEDGLQWDDIATMMEKQNKDAASFELYNLQRDINHFLPPVIPKVRLINRHCVGMDGKEVDEGLNLLGLRILNLPYAHIHFGHIRNTGALKLKGLDRIKFMDKDPCDGPGMKDYGVDWFIKRNEHWNFLARTCPKAVIKTIEKYYYHGQI